MLTACLCQRKRVARSGSSLIFERYAMPYDLSQRIETCKERIDMLRHQIEQGQAGGQATAHTERELAQEVDFLRVLQSMLAGKGNSSKTLS